MDSKSEDEPVQNELKSSERLSPSPQSFNPSVPKEFDDDVEKLKGDAIGDTLYSERFVLSTLIKLTKLDKDLSEDEDFEKDLCTLWDMTIEKDVVRLLLKHGVLELIANIVQTSTDNRLIEILVGIVGNMCSLSETRDILCVSPEVTAPILDLISSFDTLTLVQLMRLLHATLVFENTGDELTWFQHFEQCENFVDKFAYILSNSINFNLLVNTFEALNAICTKFAVIEIQPDVGTSNFRDVFVKPNLISGIVDAFKQTLPEDDENDSMEVTDKTRRIINLFLDINVILSQYDNVSFKCYNLFMDDLLKCINQILSPLCQPINLFPLTTNEQGIIENVSELSQALGDPYNSKSFTQMVTIWSLIENHRESQEKNTTTTPDWDNVDSGVDEINAEDICMTILEYLTRTSKQTDQEDLNLTLQSLNSEIVLKLYKVLSAGDSEPEIKDCCDKIQKALKSIWDTDVLPISESSSQISN